MDLHSNFFGVVINKADDSVFQPGVVLDLPEYLFPAVAGSNNQKIFPPAPSVSLKTENPFEIDACRLLGNTKNAGEKAAM